MDQRDELLQRVRDDARAISSLVSRGNVPIEKYIDKISLTALCDAMQLEPEAWQVEDLEKILIIRDGLYTLRNQLRDAGDEGEYSVEQLLSATDRLYADLERAMRSLNAAAVAEAQQEIAALQRTAQIDTHRVSSTVSTLNEEANELLTRAHVTYQRVEVSLIRINTGDVNVNVDILRNAKLVVQRMSASVFAIKLSLQQKVVFEGVFKFLSEGADKIVDELRQLVERFQKSYKQATDFISELSTLVEKGHRFTRHVAEFLQQIFGDEPMPQKQIKLRTRALLNTETMVSAARIKGEQFLLAGKDGYVCILDVGTGKIKDRHRVSDSTINDVTSAGSILIAATDRGLETINPVTLVSLDRDTIYTEKVTAVAAASWGVLSGTRDGIIRKWSIVQDSIQRYGSENLKAGRGIQRMLAHPDERILVAAGHNLLMVDQELRIVRTIPIDFPINDMCLLSSATLILCGNGKLAHVNLSKGIYTRFVFASEQTNYTCVGPIDEKTFCVGTDDGTVSAIDLLSSGEIGSMKVPFPVRGIRKSGNSLVAFGGNWHGNSKSTIAVIGVETVLHEAKELPGPGPGIP